MPANEFLRKTVLIETYWNVKDKVISINRQATYVLIETYWNVKEFDEKNCVDLSMVLIETYWNVK